jgi:hypothetical protein
MAHQIDPRRKRMSPLAYNRLIERERDERIADSDRRREAEQRDFNEKIELELAARTPEQIAQDDAELARLDAKAAEERLRQEEWLDRRRDARNVPFSTLGT